MSPAFGWKVTVLGFGPSLPDSKIPVLLQDTALPLSGQDYPPSPPTPVSPVTAHQSI